MTDIRVFDRSHIPDIAELERICFSDPYSQRLLEATAASERDIAFVAVSDGRAVGYIELGDFIDTLCVNRIAVFPEYRKRGIASALLERAAETARQRGIDELSLEVRTSNTSARALYEGFGFTLAGTRPKYYKSPPEDAAVYIYVIKP